MILFARYFPSCFLLQRRPKIKTPLEQKHVHVRGMNTLFCSMRGSFLDSILAMKPLPISEARRKRFHSITVVPYSTMELQPSANLRLPCSLLVAAIMAPKAVPSAATTLRPLPWCPSTSKAQLLLPWTALAHRPLVVDERHHELLVAVDRPLIGVLLSDAVPSRLGGALLMRAILESTLS